MPPAGLRPRPYRTQGRPLFVAAPRRFPRKDEGCDLGRLQNDFKGRSVRIPDRMGPVLRDARPFVLRDNHGDGIRLLRKGGRRHSRNRNRPGRKARFDQHYPAGPQHNHQHRPRTLHLSRPHPRGDRLREGRHHQALGSGSDRQCRQPYQTRLRQARGREKIPHLLCRRLRHIKRKHQCR